MVSTAPRWTARYLVISVVGILIADIDRTLKVAEERHVGHHSNKVLCQACCGERDATTLADPLHRNPRGIDLRETPYGLLSRHRVDAKTWR